MKLFKFSKVKFFFILLTLLSTIPLLISTALYAFYHLTGDTLGEANAKNVVLCLLILWLASLAVYVTTLLVDFLAYVDTRNKLEQEYEEMYGSPPPQESWESWAGCPDSLADKITNNK